MTDTTPSVHEMVRFALGATGDFAGVLSEADITFALDSYPSDWRLAAAFLATNLAAQALNDPSSFSLTGTMSVSWPDRAAAWRSIAYNLRLEAAKYAKDNAAPVPIASFQLSKEPLDINPAEYTRRRRPRYDRPFKVR